MLELPVKSCAIFLNRECVRNCPYCEISKVKKPILDIRDWFVGLNRLRNELGVEFFLFLGNEPLLLGNKLINLVKFLAENKYYYAMYSTSPSRLFNEMKNKLIRAGLKNWSSGVDFIPEVYEEAKKNRSVTTEVIEIVEKNKSSLVRKAEESLKGLKYMSERGVMSHALITISRMNYQFFPEMLAYFTKSMPKVHVGFSCAEWKTSDFMDFAVDKAKCPEYFFTNDDLHGLSSMVDRFIDMREKQIFYTQIPNSYVYGLLEHAVNLDWRCHGYHIPAIDCDGTFRRCGYCFGNKSASHNVLTFDKEAFLKDWEEDVLQCPGCYWAFSWIAKAADKSNELFKIENLKGRIVE